MVVRIDGTIAVPTQSAPKPKPPAVKKAATYKKPPAPKAYWFAGKSYSSQSAYAAAVAAASAAATAAARARQAAAASADLAKRASAQRAANQKRLLAYQAQAAARARIRSEQIRAQAQAKADGKARAEFERIAAIRRAKVSRELISGKSPQMLEADRAANRSLLERERKQREKRLAAARSTAYDNLQATSAALLRRGVTTDPSRRASFENPKLMRRQALVTQAETTGNWTNVMVELREQSRKSNGRYVDRDLLDIVQKEYVAPIQKLRDDFSEMVADLNAAERADDEILLLKLVEDPDNIALYQTFLQYFGDGTKPGSFTEHQQILTEISEGRERAWAEHMTEASGGRRPDPLSAKSARGRGPARGKWEMDERFQDLEYTEQVLDPETGKLVEIKRAGMDAWLARQQAREFNRMQEMDADRGRKETAIARILEAGGQTFLGYDQEGRRVTRDNGVAWQASQIRRWMPAWKLNTAGIPERIAAAADNPGKQEQLIREFMADAAKAWETNNQSRWAGFMAAAEFRAGKISEQAAAAGARGGAPTAQSIAQAEWQRAKTEWLSAVARQLNKPGWGALDELSATGIGGVAQGALTAMSLVPALVRDRLQRDFGDFQPHVDIGGLTPWDDASIQLGRTVDEGAAGARAALAQVSPFEDLGQWASVIRDNAMWGSGNLGGLLTQMVDPLMLSGPGRFTSAGALAIARAGGVRGLRNASLAGTGRLAREFARYSGPKVLGGAGRDLVKIETAKLKLAQKLGMGGSDALRLSDDEFRTLADDLARNRTEELLKSDAIKKLTEASGIEKNQLLNMVQQELPAILREFKIFAEDPFEAAARIREIRRSATRARSQAESAEQLTRMQAERTAAMQSLAEITGRPLKAPPPATKLATNARLIGAYTAEAKEYLRIAERGARAADELEKLTGLTSLSDTRLARGLQEQLRRSLQQVKKYEDQWRVDPDSGRKVPMSLGLVSKRFEQLKAFRNGGDPTAPSFVDQSLAQVRYDERRIKASIRDTLRQLKAIPKGQPLPADLKAKLQKLEQARRGLVYERALLDEGRTLMRPYARKHFDRIERTITPQRIAPLAANPEQLAVETGRDYMRMLHDAKVRPLSAAPDAWLVPLRERLAARAVDLVAELGSELAQKATRAFGREPNLQQMWTTLRMAYADPQVALEFGQAIKRLDTLMVTEARRAGFEFSNQSVREAADTLWDVLRDDHYRLDAEGIGGARYRQLDAKVEAALIEWRDFQAEGQIRLRERRFKPPSGPVDTVFHDSDPWEILVKQRVLEEEGVSIFAYDELRGVLRRTMLRQNAASGIAKRALERVAREGIDIDEALKAERAATARTETLRNVEEFSTRADLQGMPPEVRLRAFEEKMLLDDLPEMPEYTISPYQERSLRAAFEEELGFSFDDKHLIARYFRGQLVEMPEGARLPRSGEFMLFDEADGINVWVVPKGHPKLQDDIPFGRARGGDDDLEALTRDTERLAYNWDIDAGDVGGVSEISKESRQIMRGWEDRLTPGSGTRADSVPGPLQRERGKALDMSESGELPDDMAARRGATAGRRQNAAAESRRSSRRNFQETPGGRSGRVNEYHERSHGWHENAAPQGWQDDPRFVQFPVAAVGDFSFTPEQYRRWLWNEMRTSSDMRNLLNTLKGKQIVYADGIIAQTLADAVEWMKTPQAREMFAPKSSHVGLAAGEAQAGTRAQLLAQIAKYEEAHRIARQTAGFEFRQTSGRWKPATEGMLAIGEGAGDDLGDQALVWEYRNRAWHKVNDRELSREGLPSLVDLEGQAKGHHVFESTGGDWVRTSTGGDPSAAWMQKMSDFSAKIASLKRELGALDAGKPRKRGLVGLSVDGDGVYIAEGTSNVTVAHEIFHQFWDNAHNAVWRKDIEDAIDVLGPDLRTQLWSNVRIGNAAYDPAELAAELFALWRVGDDAGSDVLFSWRDLRASMGSLQDQAALDRLGRIFADNSPKVVDTLASKLRFPPLGHRARLFEWMEANGHWSRRTGEAIREGERVWSVADERRLFKGFMEYEPPWTDADVLKVVLNDPRLHNAALRQWGFFEDDFEALASSTLELDADAMVWGREGMKRQRTAAELRDWSIQRYGDLVSADGQTLIRMPWLMKADDEYIRWTEGFFDGVMQRPMAAGNVTHISQINVGSVSSRKALPEYVARVEAGEMPPLRVERQTYIDEAGNAQIETERWRLVDDADEVWVNAALAVKSVDQVEIRWGFTDQLAKAPSIKRTAGMAVDAMAARDKLPQIIRDHLFDGDTLRTAGIQIDPRLVQAREVAKLRDAIGRATRRRLERMQKVGDVEPGEWLAQESLRFAYDVTDQLLVDPVWRGILRGKPVAGFVLHAWGQLWRMLVSWQPAFPIMNLLESYGFKRLYLTVYHGGFKPLSLDADGARLIPDLRAAGLDSKSLFGLAGDPVSRIGDRNFSLLQRGAALAQAAREMPLRVSAFGEDALRLDFARRVAGDTFRTARRTGMSAENAEFLAKREAERLVDSFFAIKKGSGWHSALNELVPFFSYNFKNKTLAVRILWNHPSVWVWGERLRREVEEANRELWAKENPDLPFPTGPSGSHLWWQVGDDIYKIDLSAFSDWTRAIGDVAENHTPLEWLTEFIRVPHPSQLGALAMFTGGDTPWGNPGHIRELSFWADLFYWTRGMDYADPRRRRDFIQIMSQMLFFKKFGKIGAIDVKQSTFFALRQLDPEQAEAYLEANPDLQIYWDSLPARGKIKGFNPLETTHFRQLMSEEQNAQYDTALEGLDALNADLDARIAQYAAQPWSEEYKLAKRSAFLARKRYMSQNPILTSAWGMLMEPKEFAAFYENARVDDLADAWFNWKRPAREDYADDLAYNEALVAFNEKRAAFLDANPALMRRLTEGRNAVDAAWHGQELHWSELLDFQARLKIRILEEQQADDADQDKIELLYRARDFASADLDADRYGIFEGPNSKRGGFFASLPGFADFRYARASADEKAQMDQDAWYFNGIKSIKANSGKEFYEKLAANPKLMAEYWRRNPDKKAQFDANSEYIRWIGSWARHLEGNNFVAAQGVWDTMPAWVKERYFAKHPDSKMRDGAGGGGTAVQYAGRWFKSPASRDRYIKYIEGGGSAGSFPEGFSEPTSFRSPESRQRFLNGQAYFAAMGTWVELLKAKNFVAADKHFKGLPAWMREKYYAKHPEQRARAEIDSDALRRGAEYFLATGDDKLRILAANPQLRVWLNANGGDEGALRGLLNAMYRAIPSSEPWLKRTFRERYPEIFSAEAAGDRALRGVASELAAHPEMVPFFEKALKLQSQLFFEQLKRSKVPPKSWTMERKSRLKKRTKRRAARMHSSWTLHRDIKRY